MPSYEKAARLAAALDKLDAQEAEELESAPDAIRKKYAGRRQARLAKETDETRDLAEKLRRADAGEV